MEGAGLLVFATSECSAQWHHYTDATGMHHILCSHPLSCYPTTLTTEAPPLCPIWFVSPPSFSQDWLFRTPLHAIHKPNQGCQSTEDAGMCLVTAFPFSAQLFSCTGWLTPSLCQLVSPDKWCPRTDCSSLLIFTLRLKTSPECSLHWRCWVALRLHLGLLCRVSLPHGCGGALFSLCPDPRSPALTVCGCSSVPCSHCFPTHQATLFGRCSLSWVSLHFILLVLPLSWRCWIMPLCPFTPLHLMMQAPLASSTFPAQEHWLTGITEFFPFLLFASYIHWYHSTTQQAAVFASCSMLIPHFMMSRTALLVFSVQSLHYTDISLFLSFVPFPPLIPLLLHWWSIAHSTIHDHTLQPVQSPHEYLGLLSCPSTWPDWLHHCHNERALCPWSVHINYPATPVHWWMGVLPKFCPSLLPSYPLCSYTRALMVQGFTFSCHLFACLVVPCHHWYGSPHLCPVYSEKVGLGQLKFKKLIILSVL